MEDVTDAAFRRLVLRHGRPVVFFTEFTSVEGLMSRGRDKVIHRLRFDPEEKPIVAQVWGRDPEKYREAARLVAELGFDGIDINMGCPVPKIVKNGACAALIENPGLAAEIIQATREGASNLALSVKTRLGFKSWKTEEWTGFLLGQNLDALTVHGRIARHFSEKPANWEEIERVVQLRNAMQSKTCIVGNGDVYNRDILARLCKESTVDGFMIGRGIFDDLFIFNTSREPFENLQKSQKIALLFEHVQLFEQVWQTNSLHGPLKKFFRNYISGFPEASNLRMQALLCETTEQLRELLAPHCEYKKQDKEKQDEEFSKEATLVKSPERLQAPA